MNCIKDGKYTGNSCFGCSVKVDECEIRDKVYRKRWIPAAPLLPALLPEEYTEVPVTVYSPDGTFVSTDTYSKGEWQEYNGVKAWMPLPEQYKIDD